MTENRSKNSLPVPKYLETSGRPLFVKKHQCRRFLISLKSQSKTAPVIRTNRNSRDPLFRHSWMSSTPQQVSFVKSNDQLDLCSSSPHYNPQCDESFLEQCFIIKSKLGEGSFSQVYKVQSKDDEKLYAIKMSVEAYRGPKDRNSKLAEVQKLEQLPPHRSLIKFVQAWEERGCLFIQTELYKCSLYEWSLKNPVIPEERLWGFLVDLLEGVEFLHANDLIHMDIKLENIFLSEDGVCKLGDLGLVIDLKEEVPSQVDGDAKYLAPEVLLHHIGKHADIFSLGISMLELACDLKLPNDGVAWHLLRQGVLPEEFMQDLSADLVSVIRQMMTPDFEKRPTASQLLGQTIVQSRVNYRHLYYFYQEVVGVCPLPISSTTATAMDDEGKSDDASSEDSNYEQDKEEFYKSFTKNSFGSSRNVKRRTPLNSTPTHNEVTPNLSRSINKRERSDSPRSSVAEISDIYPTPNSTFDSRACYEEDEASYYANKDEYQGPSIKPMRLLEMFSPEQVSPMTFLPEEEEAENP